MASEYKNSIRLGISLPTEKDISSQLTTLIGKLIDTKINLDINIKNADVAKQLETLTTLANSFKTSLGGNISLGNVNEIINSATSAMNSLNDQVLKTSKINFNDGTGKQLKEVADGIGVVKKQMETLDKSGNPELEKTATTTVTNNAKIRQSIEDIAKAQKQLNALESNGFSDVNKIADLRNILSNSSSIGSDNELKGYLNQVKELLSTESKVIEYSNKLTSLKASMTNLADEKFSNVLDNGSFEKIVNEINNAQGELKNFDGINLNGLKQQFTELNNIVSNFTSETINSQKAEQDNLKQKEKLESDRITQLQKEIDLSNKLVANEQKKQVKDNSTNLKQLQEEQELLQKQAEAYKQIDVMKTNGIINQSDISKLEQMVKSANSLKDMRTALNSIMSTSMMKESSISSLSKQLDDAQLRLDKMKQTFGNKLPNSFVESIESELNKLKEDLTKVDGMNFNGIKDGLNKVNTNMKVTTNETQQLVNSLKETNNSSFFSGMSNFLGKIGVFYGVQQVVQEITSQLKNASEYTLTMDKAFTNMQMITGKSKTEISGMVNQYKQLGAELHTTNTEMMAGMEEITRAGIDGSEGEAMMSSSIIGSKVSGQSTEEVTQQLIAIKNAFNMTGESMQGVVDMISKMDNVSASSFKEIASAIQRTAFSAQEAGTPLSNLVSYITTVSEKTRKSAETIGESFKTIYSRYSNIKLGRLDDDGKSINDTELAMNRIGISIRTSKGQFKEFDEVLQQFMTKFKSGQLSQVDYLAGIQALAGTRQRETLMALMENMDTLNQHQKEVGESAGSAKKMMEEAYNGSLDAKVQDLKRAFEGLYEKILSSDSLKWLITEATQLVTALSNVDGKTILFTASIGGLVLVMSKLSALNKALIAGEAVTGLSKFIAVLSGMSTVEKTIEETTNATKALQLAQMGMVAETEGITGLKGAWLLLSTGIKEATASAMAFMLTPIGAILGVLAITLGLVVGGFISVKAHEQALTKQSTDLKTALDGVNESLKNGDTKGASDQLDKAKSSYKELTDLIRQKNELTSKPVPKEGTSDYYIQTGALQILNNKIAEHKKVLKDAGVTYDEVTGKVKEFTDAELLISNTEAIDHIKEMTKAQVEHRTNMEGMKEEYNNHISSVQNLYSEYQTLSMQENLSAEQKIQLQNVVEQLQGKVGNLSTTMDENGKVYITNTGLITDTISYLNSEGVTVETLTSIRLADQKSNATWQYNNTSITYSETQQRIAYYRQEIAQIKQLMQARMTEALANSQDGIDANGQEAPSLHDESRIMAEYGAKTNRVNAEISQLQSGLDAIDKAYSSPPPVVNTPSISSPSDGNYMPSGEDKKDKKAKEAEDKAKKLAEEIDALKSDIEPDRYLDFNNAIKNVDSELTLNKTLQDSLKQGSPEYQQAQQQEIDLYKQKQTALANLNTEQKKESDELKTKLTSMSFQFDANGKLINSQQRLLEIQKSINDETGDTEEAKKQKENDIKWLKDLQKETENYTSLVGDKIPKTTDEWQQQANAIAKVVEEQKKANEDIVNNLRDELVKDYQKDAQDEVDTLKQEAKTLAENNLKEIEDEKKAMISSYDAQVKSLQDEIKSLDDASAENKTKLTKLQAEKVLWERDNSTESTKKIQDLNTQITDLEKTIKKDDLQSQIDNLNEKKKNESDSYDVRLQEQKDANDKKEADDEETYKKMLLDETAYNKANKALRDKNTTEIETELKKHAEKWKELGGVLGDNWGDGIDEAIKKKVADTMSSIEALLNKDIQVKDNSVSSSNSSNNYKNTTSSGSNYTDIGTGIISDHPLTSDEVTEINSKSNSATKTYDNGDYEDSNGYYHSSSSSSTYYDASSGTYKEYARYAEGGRTGDLGADGKFVIADSNEMIANSDDTKKFDKMYDYIKNSGALLNQLSKSYSNIGNYTIPTLGNDLNKIINSVTTTNNNNDSKTTNLEFNSTYNVDATSDFNTKLLIKNQDKQLKDTLRKYGILK